MAGSKKIIVIGGGVIGLCSAYALARDGAHVTLLERQTIGSGSSTGNAGMVVPSHFIPMAAPGVLAQGLKWMLNPESPLYIKPRLDRGLISWLWKLRGASSERQVHAAMPLLRDLCQASLRLYDRFAVEEKLSFGWEKRGLLMLYRTDAGEDHARHEARLAAGLGIEASPLSRPELERLEPQARFTAHGGIYYPGDAHLVPAAFMDALTGCLRSRGVFLEEGVEVCGFELAERESTRNVSALRTSVGIREADEFVLAGGAWSAQLLHPLGLSLPLEAGKGYSVTIDRPSLHLTIPSILAEARVAVTPMQGRLRLAGTMELSGLNLDLNSRRLEAIIGAIPSYYAGFDPSTVDRSTAWAGLRPCSPDGLPYVGRLTTIPNLIVAAGHAMLGLTLGPITGELVSDLVAGRQPRLDLTLLRPERFS